MGKRIEASDVPVSIPFNALEKGKDSRVVRDQTGGESSRRVAKESRFSMSVGTNFSSRAEFPSVKSRFLALQAARRERITTSRHRCLSFLGTSFL